MAPWIRQTPILKLLTIFVHFDRLNTYRSPFISCSPSWSSYKYSCHVCNCNIVLIFICVFPTDRLKMGWPNFSRSLHLQSCAPLSTSKMVVSSLYANIIPGHGVCILQHPMVSWWEGRGWKWTWATAPSKFESCTLPHNHPKLKGKREHIAACRQAGLPSPLTGTHIPYGITQCYLPPGRGDIPAFTPAEAGTRFSDPGGMRGWVDLGGWLERWSTRITVTHDGLTIGVRNLPRVRWYSTDILIF